MRTKKNHSNGNAEKTVKAIRVIATKENADDEPPSEEVTGTTLAMPALQVQDVEVTVGVEQLDVSWTAVSGADGYKVQWKSGGMKNARSPCWAGRRSATRSLI